MPPLPGGDGGPRGGGYNGGLSAQGATLSIIYQGEKVGVSKDRFVIGRGMVLMAKWDPGEALRLIQDEKVTYFVGVPTMSLELMNHPDRDKYDLSTMRDVTAGGAPRPVSHVERLQKEFPNAQPALGYGLTETNAAGCSNFWQSYAAKPASTESLSAMRELGDQVPVARAERTSGKRSLA